MAQQPRYFSDEQLSGQPTAPQSPRIQSPLEIWAGKTFDSLAPIMAKEHANYMVTEQQKVERAFSDVVDGLMQEIEAGTDNDLLTEKIAIEELDGRFQDKIQELGSTNRVIEESKPRIEYLKSLHAPKLKKAIIQQRSILESRDATEYIAHLVKLAIDSGSGIETDEHISEIKKTVEKLNGSLLKDGQADDLIHGRINLIYSSQLNRFLKNPEHDADKLREWVDGLPVDADVREKMRNQVDGVAQEDLVDEKFFGVIRKLELAEQNDSINLGAIRDQVLLDSNVYGRALTMQLVGEVDRLDASRKEGEAALAMNKVNRAIALEDDPEKAASILENYKNLFDSNDYEDALLKIQISQRDRIREQEDAVRWSNVPSFEARIRMGAYDNLNSIQMRQLIGEQIVYQQSIPRGSWMQLMNAYEQRKMTTAKQSQEQALSNFRLANGMKPTTEESAKELWNRQPLAQVDPIHFDKFVDRFGSWRFQFDNTKQALFAGDSQSFARGVQMGVKLWFDDPRKFKQLMDEDAKKAIFWGYQELRSIAADDREIDPETGEPFYSPDKNLLNAHSKIMKRLYPDNEVLGAGSNPLPQDASSIRKKANSVLDNVFYSPGTASRMLPVFPAIDYLGKWFASWGGSKTLGTRQSAGFSTVFENIPAPPEDAREFFFNLTMGKMLDGVQDSQKAAELALPEFLDTYGVTRIGAEPGSAYWQPAPPETMIRRLFQPDATEAQDHAIKLFSDAVYQKAIDVTKSDPRYPEMEWTKGSQIMVTGTHEPITKEVDIIPPVRLVPKLITLDRQFPDYYLGYENDDGMFVQLREGNEPVVIEGEKVFSEMLMNSNRELYFSLLRDN